MTNSKRVLLIGAPIAALVFAGAGFGFGHFGAQPAVEAAEQRAEDSASEAQRLALELTEARHQSQLLEARWHVSVAIDELDRRNFGTAEQRLREASALLTSLSEDEPPIEGVADLAADVAAYDIAVGPDLDVIRGPVRGFATTLDQMLHDRRAGAAAPRDAGPAAGG